MGQIVAALDLGTSKTIAFVAQKELGKLSVLRTETFFSEKAIRRGRVYNSDKTSDIISRVIRKLNDNPNLQIEKIYVGIGGQSLHTQPLIVRKLVEEGMISQQLLESIKEEANNHFPEFDENLGAFSCEYYIDGKLVSNPKGMKASTIEAKFQLVVGNACLKRNLENIFKEKDITVAGYYISPLATAEAVLTPEEKEKGCALLEWGEGVTYISIYKKKLLKYLVTLPLGGLTITKDIRSLNVSEEEAEALKIKYGSAISESIEGGNVSVDEDQSSSRKIGLKDLNWIIEARVDEIVKNIWNLIQIAGYSRLLDAGIVITGGGALLRDLPHFIQNQTEKEVRLANAKVWIDQIETQLSPASSCVVGLAIMGKENCGKEIKEKVQPSLFGQEELREMGQKSGKNQGRSPGSPPKSNEVGTFKKIRDLLFDKGAKIVDKGTNLFTDDDFDNAAAQQTDKDDAVN